MTHVAGWLVLVLVKVQLINAGGREVLKVEPQALRKLTAQVLHSSFEYQMRTSNCQCSL
jgi:hypothetical protein